MKCGQQNILEPYLKLRKTINFAISFRSEGQNQPH